MIQRLYRYVCVCNEQLLTWVTSCDMKSGERCDMCARVYDVAFDGTVKPMPLPPEAKVTLNDRTIHTVYHPIKVDGPVSWLKPSIQAVLHQEVA